MRRFPKGTTQTGCRRLLPEFFAVEVYRTLDCRNSRFAAFESSDRNLDGLLLEGFVVLEKVLHLFERVLVDVCEVVHFIKADILGRHREDFVVGFAAVNHLHESDGTHRDENSRGDRIGREYDDVERVAVFPKRLRSESVIKRIRRGGKIDAVELDETRLFVYLVFVVRTTRYLNNSIECFGSILTQRYVVP